MKEQDVLADLRTWRDEFARTHGYDLAAMAATLREMDRAAGARVVRGEPRRAVQTAIVAPSNDTAGLPPQLAPA